MRVYLIGMMGAGKSRVGRLLADRLHVPFCDLDAVVEQRTGSSIAALFENEGEVAFREREQEALYATSEHDQLVVACGGGTPCFADNMAWINGHGLSVFLEVPLEELVRRLKGQTDQRPLLAGMEKRKSLHRHLEGLLARRSACYRKASVTIQAEADPEAVAALIAAHWETIIGH